MQSHLFCSPINHFLIPSSILFFLLIKFLFQLNLCLLNMLCLHLAVVVFSLLRFPFKKQFGVFWQNLIFIKQVAIILLPLCGNKGTQQPNWLPWLPLASLREISRRSFYRNGLQTILIYFGGNSRVLFGVPFYSIINCTCDK